MRNFIAGINRALSSEAQATGGLQLPEYEGRALNFTCCARFAATRDAIRAHPRRTYEVLLEHIMDKSYFPGDQYNRMGEQQAGALEPLWHVIMGGEPLTAPYVPLCSSGKVTKECACRN